MTLKIGSVLTAPSSAYVVKNILGSGTFGDVALCKKMCSKKAVAVKVMKEMDDTENACEEEAILQLMKHFGSEKHNIVQWFSSFEYRGRYCLEFEKLDISLGNFISMSESLSLLQIRPILHQLASATLFLKTMRVIHGDLKPENIMMVDHASNLKVKVIDFGLAQLAFNATRGSVIQTTWYRAPEVFVGSHFDESADIWSLGCIALEMLLGKPLFPGISHRDVVRHIVKSVGTPPTYILLDGKYTKKYFRLCNIRGRPMWRLKSLLKVHQSSERTVNRLSDLYERNPFDSNDQAQEFDFEFYIHLVLQMLALDPLDRATPGDILMHPFISMSHMDGVFDTKHVRDSVEVLKDVMQPCTSSSCSNTGTTKKRKRMGETKQETSYQDRTTNPIQGAVKPKSKPVVKRQKVHVNSGSKKRGRVDEEDAHVQHRNTQAIKKQRVMPVEKITGEASLVSRSKKRNREEEEKMNMTLRSGRVMKRQKTFLL